MLTRILAALDARHCRRHGHDWYVWLNEVTYGIDAKCTRCPARQGHPSM